MPLTAASQSIATSQHSSAPANTRKRSRRSSPRSISSIEATATPVRSACSPMMPGCSVRPTRRRHRRSATRSSKSSVSAADRSPLRDHERPRLRRSWQDEIALLLMLRGASALCHVGRTGRVGIVECSRFWLGVRALFVATRDVVTLGELDRSVRRLAGRVYRRLFSIGHEERSRTRRASEPTCSPDGARC